MDELELETKLSEMISNTFWVTSWNNFPVYNSGISQRVKSKYPLWSWNTPSDAEIHTLSSGICNFQWVSMSGIWSMWVVLRYNPPRSCLARGVNKYYIWNLQQLHLAQNIMFHKTFGDVSKSSAATLLTESITFLLQYFPAPNIF